MNNSTPPAPETIIIPQDQRIDCRDLSPKEFNERFSGWRYLLMHQDGAIIAASNESREAMLALLMQTHPDTPQHELMYRAGPVGLQAVFDALNQVRGES